MLTHWSENCGCYLYLTYFKHISITDIVSISHAIARSWTPYHTVIEKSVLVLVIAWWCQLTSLYRSQSPIAKFMGPTWGPPGSCRPQMGPMLAPWTLLSGMLPQIRASYGVTRSPHYNDVIMTTIASEITSFTVVYSTVYSDANQKNIKPPCHWPLCGEFTGTKGQLRGKCFHLMTSSWSQWKHIRVIEFVIKIHQFFSL